MPPGVRVAVESTYRAAKANPQNPDLNGQLGIVLLSNNLGGPEAETSFRRASLLDKSSLRWSYLLGTVLAREGKFQAASGAFREAVRINPKYLPARLNLGECLLAEGHWQEASDLFEALAKEDPANPHAYFGLARARAARSDLNGAAVAFGKACELFPKFAAAHYGLARIYERLGNEAQSSQEMNLYAASAGAGPPIDDPVLAAALVPTTSPSDELRQAADLAEQGKFSEAVQAYELALEKYPNLEKANVNLISLYGRLGQVDKAEQHFRAAVRLEPRDPDCYFNHGLLLASEEKYSEAEQSFRKVLEIDPRYPEGHTNLGYMLEAQGKLDEAVAEYEKTIAASPEDAPAHFALGRIATNQEKFAEGIEHFQICVRTGSDENRPAYLYALGAAYARAGDRENALRYLRQARQEAATRGQPSLEREIESDLKSLEAATASP